MSSISWQPISTLLRSLERKTLVVAWSELTGDAWSMTVGPNDELPAHASHWMLPPVTGGAK
jgi:hypothetical protein